MRHISPASGLAPVRSAAVLSLSWQLAVLMRLHNLAQRETDLDFFLQESCRSAAEGVGAGFAGVLQYRTDKQMFVLQAGIGMQAGLVGRARIAADLGTTAGLAWHTDQLVHFRGFASGGRIRTSGDATGHDVRQLVSVPVHGEGEEAFGVLEVGNAEAGEFTQCDLAFLQAAADCIGAAVARHAHRMRRADRAMLAAERRSTVREPQLDGARRPDVRMEADEPRRAQDGGGTMGRPAIPNAAPCRQAPTFGGLQQDAQISEGNG